MVMFKKDKKTGIWEQYFKIDNMRGSVYFIKGNVRFQITTEQKIYFYLIDKETLLPELENVMWNFMGCSTLMFGARVKFSISFKANESDIKIYSRNNFHNFKVCVNDKSFEGAVGCELVSFGMYCLASGLRISIYKSGEVTEHDSWTVKVARDDVKVLFLRSS